MTAPASQLLVTLWQLFPMLMVSLRIWQNQLRVNDMSSLLLYLFDLDRQIRVYLRFLIESFSILAVYVLCVTTSDVLGQLSIATHIFNGFIWIVLYRILHLHEDRLRFLSVVSYLPIFKASLLSGSILVVESAVFAGDVDVLTLTIYSLLSFNILVGLRVLARQFIRREANKSRENILVYGTSNIAIDLVNAMAFGRKYNVIGFVSDIPQSIGTLAGLPVIPFNNVEQFARVNACQLVVLASNLLTPAHQTEVLRKLAKLELSVSHAPTMDRAFDYEVQLKAVKPEEVLGRKSEIQFDDAVRAELNNKTILVTGAGGSIGSEICRQILRYQPAKLIVLELSELALYTLEQEISEVLPKLGVTTQVNYILGSVTDEAVLTRIFNDHGIEIVYHAAAYKHVPIVEDNVTAGIKNNVFGTKYVAEFAHRCGAEKFVLISTDKAVRPTNVMGASKRLAEFVIQDLSKSSETIFTMVRFGNVLGSSGSVIPKFKSQINAGGPVTVTHKEITRYFMSIPEAAHLVLNAGTFANGGDVFLLDMGDPVKILEVAKSMIRQHGRKPILSSDLKGRQKFDNEIVIEFSGLRPGEKLYEELLVDGVVQKTKNPQIFQSMDGINEELDLKQSLKLLADNVQENRIEEVKDQLRKLPLSYQPNGNFKHGKASAEKDHRTKHDRVQGREKKASGELFLGNLDRPSFLKRLFSFKLSLALIHKYFLVSRGMTLGVRVLVQNNQGEVLVVNHSYVKGLFLPGGGVDIGEDVEYAARREILEETGVSELVNLTFLGIDFNESVSKRDHVIYFKAFANTDVLRKGSAEILDAFFVPKEKLADVLDPVQWKFLQDKL